MPIEPVALSDFFLSFFSAAMLILLAALYAALFAWGKTLRKPALLWGAAVIYLALLVCLVVFSQVNHFNGFWQILSVLMACGYAVAPYVILRLCQATHDGDSKTSHRLGE
jgi:hypothetical protein